MVWGLRDEGCGFGSGLRVEGSGLRVYDEQMHQRFLLETCTPVHQFARYSACVSARERKKDIYIWREIDIERGIYIYIYIYIEREREKERESTRKATRKCDLT